MDRLLSELTDWLIHNHAISSDDKELYEYAIYSFIISTVPLVIFLVVSGISIAINSPIDHENKRLTEQEKMRYQRTTIVLVLAACFVSVVMNVMGYNRYSSCVALGVILTGVLQLPVIIRKIMR